MIRYPTINNETEGEALNSAYIYGVMDFGSFSRIIFTRPLIVNTEIESVTVNSLIDNSKNKDLTILEDKVQTDLPPEKKNSLQKKNEKSAKISYRICIFPGQANIPKFRETLKSQIFSLEIYAEDLHLRAFNIRNNEEYRNLSLLEKNTNFVILKSDLFLIKCIEEALQESSKSMVRSDNMIYWQLHINCSISFNVMEIFLL